MSTAVPGIFIYVRFYLSALSTQWSVSVKDDTVAGEPHDNRISGTYFNILICYDFLRLCNQNVPFFVFPCEQLLERPVYGKGAFL